MSLANDFRAAMRRFHRDERGNVAMLFGVSFIVVMICGGMAFDLGRAFVAKSRLEHALDDAALAVGASATNYSASEGLCTSSGETYLTNIAQQYMNANYDSSLGTASAVQVCQSNTANNGQNIVVGSTVTVPTTFMRIFGWQHLDLQVNAIVTRALSGLEVVLVLDNTASMQSNTTDGVNAFVAVKQAAYQLVNTLWANNSQAYPISPTPAGLNTLFVGILPFTGLANVVNTGTNATAGTANVAEIMGATDYSVKVGDIVNTTSGTLASPLCGYNGTWTPSSDDYIAPLDLVHLAQDLCAFQMTGMTVNSSTGAQTAPGGFKNLYLVDYENASLTTPVDVGYAWAGCLEGRLAKGDSTTTPYWDVNKGISSPSTEFDHELEYTDLTIGTAATAEHFWHLYRGTTSGSDKTTRNTGYLTNPGLPNVSGKLVSTYYAAATASAPSHATAGSSPWKLTWTWVTNYNYPVIIVGTEVCIVQYDTQAHMNSAAGGTAPSACPTNVATGGTGFTSQVSDTTTYSTSGSTNYYWTTPSSSSNAACIASQIQPLTNAYTDISSTIDPSMTSTNYNTANTNDTGSTASTTYGMDDKGGTGTIADYAWAWAARLLSYDGTNYHPPFLEAKTIDSSTTLGATGWKKAVVFMTDGNMNFTTSDYTLYSSNYGGSQGDILVNAIKDMTGNPTNAAIAAAGYPTAIGWTGTSASCSTYGATTGGSSTTDDYQIMCRIYKVCSAMRAQDYYMYTVLFSHDTTDSPSSDEGKLMTACTADGSGNIDTSKAFNVVTASSLGTAFSTIGAQLAQLRISR